MKKKIIAALILVPIIIFGIIVIFNPSLLPSDLLQVVRSLRDQGQELLRSTERSVGIPLKAEFYDSDFIITEFVSGLRSPTSMTFVGNDILILEKNHGIVEYIKNGIIQSEPALDVEVSFANEQGLLGILNVDSAIYLYFTEAENDGDKAIGNHIYKYTWDGETLKDPILINELPSKALWHNGGKIIADNNGNIFAVIGDQTNTYSPKEKYRILENFPNGDFDDTGVIIRVGIDNSITKPMESPNPLEHYYAMGIRNSFGIAIDPLTGHLWDTENGPEGFDEINLVLPKFNSGWVQAMGPATQDQIDNMSKIEGFAYSDPEFSWEKTVVPTDLIFPNSEPFKKYHNSLFVGDCLGNLYKFNLNEERTGFIINDPNLQDLVVNIVTNEDGIKSTESMDEILLGTGFGCITDLEFGSDGLLYIISLSDNVIYRIEPI